MVLLRLAQPRPSKAWRYYKATRRLFNWSVEEGLLDESPVKGLRFKAPPPPPIQPYNLNELKRFLAVRELDMKTGARSHILNMRLVFASFHYCQVTQDLLVSCALKLQDPPQPVTLINCFIHLTRSNTVTYPVKGLYPTL